MRYVLFPLAGPGFETGVADECMVEQARIPERWMPGTFDLVGSSHQIFHVLVVMAACSHLVGLLKAAEHAERMGTCEDII